MENHIKNVGELLSYALKEIESKQVIEVLGRKIHHLVDIHVMKRDIQNFISYLRFVLSAPVVPKKLYVDIKLIKHFIDRTYVGFDDKVQASRTDIIYNFITHKIKAKSEINEQSLSTLEAALTRETRSTFEKLKDYILVALLLKWFNGALRDKLSQNLNDFIVYLATIFGQLQSDRILNVEDEIPQISQHDMAVLAMEYAFFEAALMDGIQKIQESITDSTSSKPLRDQFRVVFECLDNLINTTKKSQGDELSSFRDKIVISTALVYLQDDFVAKDPEVSNLINLFVSMYYQFRDKRY